MEAGRLRQRVTIQYKVVVKDTYGQETITWTELAEVWASVEPLTGREYMEGRQEAAEVSTRIRVRYRSGIEPEMRVVCPTSYGSVTYNVLAVLHQETRKREIQLMCREIDE
jgi:SPP1 family predicted phage head-tail adaptor